MTGHNSLREVERYTKAADQVRLAKSAMAKTATVDGSKATAKLSERKR